MPNIFERLLGLGDDTTTAAEAGFEPLQLAAGALLVEAASMDGEFSDEERTRIEGLLQNHFDLSPALACQLTAEAEAHARDSVEWHGYTSVVKQHYDDEERIRLLEMLWEVAYTDGRLHDYEASLLRRVTGLLYISDRDSGEARKRVRERLGVKEE